MLSDLVKEGSIALLRLLANDATFAMRECASEIVRLDTPCRPQWRILRDDHFVELHVDINEIVFAG